MRLTAADALRERAQRRTNASHRFREEAIFMPDMNIDQIEPEETKDMCFKYWGCIGCPRTGTCEAFLEAFGEDV